MDVLLVGVINHDEASQRQTQAEHSTRGYRNLLLPVIAVSTGDEHIREFYSFSCGRLGWFPGFND